MKRTIIFIFMIFVLTGCARPQVKDISKQHSHLSEPASAIVLSINPEDKDFAECVQRELENHITTLTFVPEEKFRDALFPWFEPSTAPKSIEELGSTMNRPLVRNRIQGFGIRFVIFVGGHKSKEKFEGPFIVTGGFGAAGALGYTSSDRKTEISAVVWDLKEMASLKKWGQKKWGQIFD